MDLAPDYNDGQFFFDARSYLTPTCQVVPELRQQFLERLLRHRPPTALNARTRWEVVLYEDGERGNHVYLP